MDRHEPVDALLSVFKALADENRLRMLGVLAQGPQTVEQLAEILHLRASTVSHHLARLAEVGLVSARAESYYNIYSLQNGALERLAQTLLAKDALVVQAASLDLDAFDRKVVADFSLPDGRLKTIPAQRKKLEVILRHVLRDFEPGAEYSEAQVNQILGRYHPDVASLRRELIVCGLMERDKRGLRYRRSSSSDSPTRDAGGLPSGLPSAALRPAGGSLTRQHRWRPAPVRQSKVRSRRIVRSKWRNIMNTIPEQDYLLEF